MSCSFSSLCWHYVVQCGTGFEGFHVWARPTMKDPQSYYKISDTVSTSRNFINTIPSKYVWEEKVKHCKQEKQSPIYRKRKLKMQRSLMVVDKGKNSGENVGIEKDNPTCRCLQVIQIKVKIHQISYVYTTLQAIAFNKMCAYGNSRK